MGPAQHAWRARAQSAQPNRLIGRDREIAAATSLLAGGEVRVMTVVGPAGAGKTRFAMALTDSIASGFELCGFVDLVPVTDADLVLWAIARAVGVEDSGGGNLRDRLAVVLGQRRVLLLVDNFEHVIDGAVTLAELAVECPGLVMVVTSRQPLRLSWERIIRLNPLGVPPVNPISPAEVAAETSVQLFRDRVRAASGEFEIGEDNFRVVAEICRQLDGLPLALELAAARTHGMPLVAIRDRLESGLEVLGGGSRDNHPRHRSLESALNWSHQLLAAEARALLRRLSVFPRGAGLAAVSAICAFGNVQPAKIDDLLAELVDGSLLVVSEGDGEVRYHLLETVRAFAGERLLEAGEASDANERLLAWCVGLVDQAWAAFATGEEPRWLALLDLEAASLRTAMDWGFSAGRHQQALRLVARLWRWWDVRGHVPEGLQRITGLLVQTAGAEDTTRAEALMTAGHLAALHGDISTSELWCAESIRLARAVGAHVVEVRARLLLAISRIYHHPESALRGLRGRSFQDHASLVELAWASWVGAGVALGRGDSTEARRLYQEALTGFRTADHEWSVAFALRGMAIVDLADGNPRRAAAAMTQALTLRLRLADRRGVADSLEVLAGISARLGAPREAARLLGAAETQRARAGAALVGAQREIHVSTREYCSAKLGEAAAAALTQEGRVLEEVDALKLARGLRAGDASGSAESLTSREREVARLVASGLRNREIAADLGMTVRTAESHVEHIRSKLGVQSRAQIATWAVANHLATTHRDLAHEWPATR